MKAIFLKKALPLFIVLFLFTLSEVNSQEIKSFSLNEALEYASTNAYKSKTSALDFQSTMAKKREFTAMGLPQVNANAGYQYYMNIPTTLMPNFLTPAVEQTLLNYGLISKDDIQPASGEMYPVQFGSTNNLTVGITASQLLFDGTYVVGLKAARILVDMSQTNLDKTINETKAAVAQAYYLVLVAQENYKLLDSTYLKMKEILEQNKVIQKNGFIEETDIEQLTLNVSNLKTKLDFTQRNIALVTDLLKFQMGIDINETIRLTDNLNSLIDQAVASNIIDKPFEVNTHFDYKIIKTSELLQRQSLKVDQSKYYPSLSMFFNAQSNAQRQEFDFFDGDGKWYNTTLIGFNLSVPIWSSGSRHYKIQQTKFNIKKQEILGKQIEQGLKIDVQNSKLSLKMYTEQLYTDKTNLDLSVKIYRKTYTKFKEGLASALDLNQAYLQLLTQEGNYINNMMQLLNTYTNLCKAMNTL